MICCSRGHILDTFKVIVLITYKLTSNDYGNELRIVFQLTS